MKKMSLKKLSLSRETLHRLTALQAKAAFGGDVTTTPFEPPPLTSDSVHACCV
jgi:hypothetical protein